MNPDSYREEYLMYPANFFTATNYEWKPALADDINKEIIVESLQFLVDKKRIELNAFVIMNNHIHIIWQALQNFTPAQIQASFLNFTAKQLRLSFMKNDIEFLASLKVNKHDREYQIWKREPLSIELLNKYYTVSWPISSYERLNFLT